MQLGSKRQLALAAAAGLAASVSAQGQLTIVNTEPGTFMDISATGTVLGPVTDDSEHNFVSSVGNAAFPAGNIRVGSNGVAVSGITTGDIGFTNNPIPAGNALPSGFPAGGQGYLAPFWDDLYPVSGQENMTIFWQEIGDTLIIQWTRHGHITAVVGQDITFQIQVFRTGPYLAQFIYPDTVFGGTHVAFDNAASATIGWAGGSSSLNPNVQYSHNMPSIQDGTVLTLIPDTGPTGACCLPNLTCAVVSAASCGSASGVYRGDGVTCAAANCPMAWQEQGEAGDLPATAQTVSGSGPLPGIMGNVTSGDSDMYRIQICDSGAFQATTVGGATFDTQLFLFDSTGHGVTANDDEVAGTTLQSRLTAQFIPGNGEYFLAVDGYNRDPLGETTAGLIWDNSTRLEHRPDGPASPEAIGSWGTGGGSGSYTVYLTGACYIGQGATCYPDCNQDHALNVNDFVCFQTAFAGGVLAQADCNHDAMLNVNDFVCFQAAFAAGCSQL